MDTLVLLQAVEEFQRKYSTAIKKCMAQFQDKFTVKCNAMNFPSEPLLMFFLGRRKSHTGLV